MRIPPRLLIALLVVYTGLLLTATHWPGLAIRGPIDRTDLIIHACVFGAWAVLLGASGLVGRSLSAVLVAGIAFAVFDETTQPLFRRVFDWLDLAADITGVLLGCGLLHLMRLGRARGERAPA